MAPTNVFFSPAVKTEQLLYEDLVIEGLRMYGQDVLYIPRVSITTDEILNEDYSRFEDAYQIEMYIANTQGFEGEGTLLSKFGLEIRDQATFIVARRRFRQFVEIDSNAVDAERPREGDLIYLPLSNSMFEIKFVEHEQPFYRLNDLPIYELQCEMFEYSSEQFDTGRVGADQFESEFATRTVLAVSGGSTGFAVSDRVYQTAQEEVKSNASIVANVNISTEEVTGATIEESGFGYVTPPTLIFPKPRIGTAAEGTAVLGSDGSVVSVTITDPGSGYKGDVRIEVDESPVDDIPLIRVSGEVADFIDTTEDGATTRTGDLSLVQVVSTVDDIPQFNPDDGNLYREDDDSDTGWSLDKVYGLGDVADNYIPEDPFADNTQFEIEGNSIIDFSEINPFGDPRVDD